MSFTIQFAVESHRLQWKPLRHTDGAKHVMSFGKRQQAMRHIRKRYHDHIRLVHPDGTVEAVR